MIGRNRRNFSPGFRFADAQLVLDQHYSLAATAMNVGKSTMDKWVRQLKEVSVRRVSERDRLLYHVTPQFSVRILRYTCSGILTYRMGTEQLITSIAHFGMIF